MDVDVNILRVDRERDVVSRLGRRLQHALVGLKNRLVKRGMPHIASVDEEILVTATLGRRFRTTDETVDGDE